MKYLGHDYEPHTLCCCVACPIIRVALRWTVKIRARICGEEYTPRDVVGYCVPVAVQNGVCATAGQELSVSFVEVLGDVEVCYLCGFGAF